MNLPEVSLLGSDPLSPCAASMSSSSASPLLLSDCSPDASPGAVGANAIFPVQMAEEEGQVKSWQGVMTRENSDPMLSDAQEFSSRRSSGVDFEVNAVSSRPNYTNVPVHDQVIFEGCFQTTLNSFSREGQHFLKNYSIHVFNKGCYFKPGSEPDANLMEQIKTVSNTFNVNYFKNDPKRQTFDQIQIQLNMSWISLTKPGSATSVFEMVFSDQPFFLQTTATPKADHHFRKFGVPWVETAQAIVSFNSSSAAFNPDIGFLVSKRPVAVAAISQNQSISPGNVETVNNSVPSNPVLPEQSHVSNQSSNSIPSCSTNTNVSTVQKTSNAIAEKIKLAARLQIMDNQYGALTQRQLDVCTSCSICRKEFKYVMDHLYHFNLNPKCRAELHNSVFKDMPGTFYANYVKYISGLCDASSHIKFNCTLCDTVLDGPMQYGIHRDQHRPLMFDLKLCPFCSVIFRTPHGFLRHSCIKLWDVTKLYKELCNSRMSLNRRANGEVFKIYSELSEIEKDSLIRCPHCLKSFYYISGLMAHLKSEASCMGELEAATISLPQSNQIDQIDFGTYLLQKMSIKSRSIKCEDCTLVCKDQIGYAIHRDHHALKKKGTFICKGCNCEYQSPCEFYRHNCSARDKERLPWCPFCDVSYRCDNIKEEIDKRLETARIAQAQRKKAALSNTHHQSLPITMSETEPNSSFSTTTSDSLPGILSSPLPSVLPVLSPQEINEVIVPEETQNESNNISKMNNVDLNQAHSNHSKMEKNTRKESQLATKRKLTSNGISPGKTDLDNKSEPKAKTAKNSKVSSTPTSRRNAMRDKFLCTDCKPHKILNGPSDLTTHIEETDSHFNIDPLWVYDGVRIDLSDVAKVDGRHKETIEKQLIKFKKNKTRKYK